MIAVKWCLLVFLSGEVNHKFGAAAAPLTHVSALVYTLNDNTFIGVIF